VSSSARGRRQLLLVLCTAIVALAVAAVYLAVRSTEYEATTDVLVAPLASDDPEFQNLPLIRESSDGSRPVQTAAGLLRGAAITSSVATKLGGDWTDSKVEGAVQVQPRGESNIVAITATADDPDEAADIANSYAHAALEFRRHTIAPALNREIQAVEEESGRGTSLQRLRDVRANGDPTLAISSPARPPSSSSQISPQLVLLAALLIGLLIGLAAIVVANVARVEPAAAPRPQ
jgi:capsular polysaccharide biosynthesis protein